MQYISTEDEKTTSNKNMAITPKKIETPVTNIQVDTPVVMNADVKTFKQTIKDDETDVVVKHLYYLRIVRGNVTVQINVGEKTYTQVKQLTEKP